MPNWVYNTLTIEGSKQVLESITNHMKNEESDFSFQKIVPRPAYLDATDAWYEWNITNWGCKWDASDVYLQKVGDKLVYTFSTPWSAPLNLINILAQHNPEAIFEYHFIEEQGWGGVYKFKGKIYCEEDSWDIPESHRDMLQSRGMQCYCHDNEDPYFDDCFYERAKLIPDLSAKTLEVIKALTKEWDQGFEALVKTASKI